MTSENKISIVVAFGLLIFVSMLIADHFSRASTKEVAGLGTNTPPPPLLTPSKLIDGPIPIELRSLELRTHADPWSGDVTHVVRKGETLRSICNSHYGDSGLANAVAQWNRLPNADAIEKGLKISLPVRNSLVSVSFQTNIEQAIQVQPNQIPSPMRMGTYKVKSGDTLSEIAQDVMGSVKNVQQLIDLNKDVMSDPDQIQVGMLLKYPLH